MEELRFKADVENVVTLKGGMTIVKLRAEEPEAPSEISLTYNRQTTFQTGEYEVSLKKVVPAAEPEETE